MSAQEAIRGIVQRKKFTRITDMYVAANYSNVALKSRNAG